MRIALAAFAAAFVLAGCRDSTGPAGPASIEIVAGRNQEAAVGTRVPEAPTFVIRDQNGRAVAGIPVTITITLGGGMLTNAATVSASEPVPVGEWTLGPTLGTNQLTISSGALAPATITAVGRAGPPASLLVLQGDGQSAQAANDVPAPIRLRLRDALDNPVAGVPVAFSILSGGGQLHASTAMADDAGVVTVPGWTLGKRDVPQIIRVAAGNLFVDVTAHIQTDFFIELRFLGSGLTASRRAAFENAAARLQAIIVGDLSDIALQDFNLGQCHPRLSGQTYTGVLDDVLIYAIIEPIDGPGGVLGSAGLTACQRFPGPFPAVGIMRFDEADIPTLEGLQLFEDVILHEMLHVMGIGTLWNGRGLLTGVGTPDVAYVGSHGIGGCHDVGGMSACGNSVPVENQGGPGTAGSHWREATFRNELMTGFINQGGNPMSLITIRSLRDLGYTVNAAAYDDYVFSAQVISPSLTPSGAPPWEEIITPDKILDISTGRAVPVAQPQ